MNAVKLDRWEHHILTDYRKIRAPRFKSGLSGNYAKLMPIQTVDRFKATRDFLRESMAESFSGPTVVVTHHAPNMKSVRPALRDNIASAAYASNLLSEVEWEPEYWIHGHIHTSSGYFTGNTHVICNPRGYAEQTGNHLNPEFDPNLSIEI